MVKPVSKACPWRISRPYCSLRLMVMIWENSSYTPFLLKSFPAMAVTASNFWRSLSPSYTFFPVCILNSATSEQRAILFSNSPTSWVSISSNLLRISFKSRFSIFFHPHLCISLIQLLLLLSFSFFHLSAQHTADDLSGIGAWKFLFIRWKLF